jgi:hypothetical protein
MPTKIQFFRKHMKQAELLPSGISETGETLKIPLTILKGLSQSFPVSVITSEFSYNTTEEKEGFV